MTDGTREAIALARKIAAGTRGELGRDRAEDSMTIVRFAHAIAELSRPNKCDQERVERADWQRSSGDVECPTCGHVYYDHPTVPGFEWLHRTCSGKLYKL
jgi:hypothetical protein